MQFSERATLLRVQISSLFLWTSPSFPNLFICVGMGEKTALYIELCEFVNLDSIFNIIRISCSKTSHLQHRSGWNTALSYRTPSSRM
jgi:hypothetical protein